MCYSFRDEWFILLYVLYCGLTVPQYFPFITSVFSTYGNISIVNLQKHQTYVCEMIKSKLIKNIKIKAVADSCAILFVDTMNSIRKTINPINFFIMKYVIGFVFYTAQSAMNKYGNTDFLYMLMFYGYIKKIFAIVIISGVTKTI